ncbi:MAG: hypothetical protein K2K82_08690 [Muribaculaceae bacterium]|nr:hypothetical protein [Muribaculaceae bacterium]
MSEKENKVYNLSDIIGDGTQLAQGNYFVRGDWACVKESGKKGLVKETHNGDCEQLVTLLMEDGTILKIRSDECTFTTPDPKTAFLTELSELLRKYDAKIHDGEYYYIGFEIGANSDDSQMIHCELSKTDDLCITADNVINFNKD